VGGPLVAADARRGVRGERLFRTTTRESHDCGRLGPVEKKDVSENDKKKRSFDVFTVVLFLARATRRIPL
jgi:hypothetical protein